MKMRLMGMLLVTVTAWPAGGPVDAAEKAPIEVISDNSFLIEEAYHQEPGVVQHSFNAVYLKSGRLQAWGFNFTQEWPVFSQDHQLSYSIPSYHNLGAFLYLSIEHDLF